MNYKHLFREKCPVNMQKFLEGIQTKQLAAALTLFFLPQTPEHFFIIKVVDVGDSIYVIFIDYYTATNQSTCWQNNNQGFPLPPLQ